MSSGDSGDGQVFTNNSKTEAGTQKLKIGDRTWARDLREDRTCGGGADTILGRLVSDKNKWTNLETKMERWILKPLKNNNYYYLNH